MLGGNVIDNTLYLFRMYFGHIATRGTVQMMMVRLERFGKFIALLPAVHYHCYYPYVREGFDGPVNTYLIDRRAGFDDVGNAERRSCVCERCENGQPGRCNA